MQFFKLPGVSTLLLKIGFVVKLLAGISVGLIYTYYYTDRLTADTFKFFDDSKVLFNSLKSNPLDFIRMFTGINSSAPELEPYYNTMKNWYDTFSPFNDNRTMIRLNALLRFISMGYYYVHVVFVCFLSFTGIIAIVKVFEREFPNSVKETFLVFLLLPSVLFWGSGLLKDALVFFAFGMVLLYFNRILYTEKNKSQNIVFFILTLLLLMLTKFQVFLISLPLFLGWLFAEKSRMNAGLAFLLTTVIFIFAIFISGELSSQWDTISLLVNKQQAFFDLAQSAGAGSFIAIPKLEPTLSSIILNAPLGFMSALFRPFITDTGAILNTISAIENTLILILGIFCIYKFKKSNFSGKILPYFCLFYIVYSFTLIGLITPVLGALVRYKAQALPFMVMLFILVSQPAIKNIINKFIPKTINQ